MSKTANIDFEKIWRNLLLLIGGVPFKFALHCWFFYATLPQFFGTSFGNGFLPAVYLTAGFWAVIPLIIAGELLVLNWKRKLVSSINPELGDLRQLKVRRKQHEEIANLLANGLSKRAVLTSVFSGLKGLPRSLCRVLIVLSIAVNVFPDLFVHRSLSTVVEFALVFGVFEWLLNSLFALFLIKDYRRPACQSTADGTEHKGTKRGAITQALNEVQEEQAIESTRYNLAIEMNPTPENYMQRARKYLKSKDAIPAVDDFEQVMRLDPTSAEAYEGRAEAYQSMGLFYIARNDLLQAAKLASEFNPSVHERILAKLQDLGSRSNPLNPFRNTRETLAATSTMFNPDSKAMDDIKLENVEMDLQANIRSSEVYLRQASALYRKSDYPGALIACDKSIELNPENGPSYRTRASAYVQMLNMEAAMRDYDKAIKLNEEDWDSYEERARIKLVFGEYDAVVRECTHAMESSKSCQFKLMRGTALVALKRHEDALVDLTEFIDRWEKFIALWDAFWLPVFRSIADGLRYQLREAYEQRAIAYDELGDLDKAARDLVKATQLKEREERKSRNRKIA